MAILIRTETVADEAAVFAINEQAFDQPDEARLVDALRRSKSFVPSLSLVAEADGQVVGHILFTTIRITRPHAEPVPSLALAPVAVLPAWQRQQIGSQLIQNSLQQAKRLGYSSVIVLGHEHYYPKYGFRPAQEWGITAPFEVPAAAFMALELVPGSLAEAQGVVQYDPAFGI